MTKAQRLALRYPSLLAEETAHPRFGTVTQRSARWSCRSIRGTSDWSFGLGGPVWHAFRTWFDGDGVMHVRRRLTVQERKLAGDLQVRDIRGTEEEARRLRRLLRDAPQLRSILERIR